MGAHRLFTTLRRLVAGRRMSKDNGAASTSTATPTHLDEADAAAIARRASERARFADDAAYFEYLIERAVASADPT